MGMGGGAVGGYNSSLTHFLLWALLWHPAGNDIADLHAYVTKLLAVSSLGRGDIVRDANMSWPRIESCFWIFLSGLRHHADLSGAFRSGGDSFCHTLLRSAVSDSWSLIFRNLMTQWLQSHSCMHAHKIQATRGESDPFGKPVLKCVPWQIVWLALRVCGAVWGGLVRQHSSLGGQMGVATEALQATSAPKTLQNLACFEP